MAFNKTSQDPTMMEIVGSYTGLAFGISSTNAGTITITFPGMSQVYGGTAMPLNTTVGLPITCTATSGNTATFGVPSSALIGVGNAVRDSTFSYMVWGLPKL